MDARARLDQLFGKGYWKAETLETERYLFLTKSRVRLVIELVLPHSRVTISYINWGRCRSLICDDFRTLSAAATEDALQKALEQLEPIYGMFQGREISERSPGSSSV